MKISIIVTTYNRPGALVAVLSALAHQTQMADEVIVADDGSSEETTRLVRETAAGLPYPLRHIWHEDKGFRAAKIRNDAIREASGTYIVFLDGDCVPNRHFVADHGRLAREGCFFQGKRVLVEKAGVDVFDWQAANSRGRLLTLLLNGSLSNAHHLLRLPWWPPMTSPGLSGTRSCNLGLFRTDLLAVNGFNEAFEGWGREDSELVARLYNYGLKRIIHPFRAICFHLWHEENSRERLVINDEILSKALLSDDYFTPHGVVKGP